MTSSVLALELDRKIMAFGRHVDNEMAAAERDVRLKYEYSQSKDRDRAKRAMREMESARQAAFERVLNPTTVDRKGSISGNNLAAKLMFLGGAAGEADYE